MYFIFESEIIFPFSWSGIPLQKTQKVIASSTRRHNRELKSRKTGQDEILFYLNFYVIYNLPVIISNEILFLFLIL